MKLVRAVSFLVFLFPAIGQSQTLTNGFSPNNPGEYGFSLIFQDSFSSCSTIDLSNTLASGFNWYVTVFFTDAVTPSGDLSCSGGFLTITPTTGDNTAIYSIATAAPIASNRSWVGTTFGPNYGPGNPKAFYFEASIAFNAATVDTANGWPAFWAEPVQAGIYHGTAYYYQWPGQATAYNHFVEDDMFEFLDYGAGGCSSNCTKYSVAMHDWYGIYNVTCANSCFVNNTNATVTLGSSPTWTNFNKIGQLWVLGTASNNYVGYVINYFNGVQVSETAWVDPGGTGVYSSPSVPNPITPPPAYPFAFSVMDSGDYFIALGSGAGQALKVSYVHVWELQ